MLIPYFIILKYTNNMKKYILLLFLAFGSSFCMAQNMPNFNKNYNFPPDYALILTDIFPTDTGYFAVGTMVDSLYRVWAGTFICTDLNGNVKYLKKYSNRDTSVYFTSNIVKNNAGFLLGGSFGIRDTLNSFFEYNSLWNIDIKGDIIWQKTHSHSNLATGVDVLLLTNGQIWAKKAIYDVYRLELLDSLGDTIKTQNFPNNTIFNLYGSIQQSGDNIILACSDYNTLTDEQRHFYYSKDTAFNTIDSFYISQRYGNLKYLDKINANTFVASGQRIAVSGTDIGYPHIYVLDSNLNRTMNCNIRGDNPDDLCSAVRTFGNSDGSYTVLGTSILEQQNRDMGFIARVSENGQLLWQKGLYMPQHSHRMYSAAQTADGGYVVCGDILGPVTGYYQQGWLMKIDSFGCVLPNCHLATEEALETKQPAMLLYPNPASTHINIHIALPEGVEITPAYMDLIDNKGRVLETNKLPMQDMNYEFYLYNYVPGNYFIRIRQGNKQATKQFVKVRG